jgi:hypothetical protein
LEAAKTGNNKLTIPREPRLSYNRSRSKKSPPHNMQKELMVRNLSLENIPTRNYGMPEENVNSFHKHYYEEDEQELNILGDVQVERIYKKNMDLIAEKMLQEHGGTLDGVNGGKEIWM